MLALTLAGAGAAPAALAGTPASAPPVDDAHLKDYLHKMRHFNRPFAGDIYVAPDEKGLLQVVLQRFQRLQRLVGFGNFYLLDFDEALAQARTHARVGAFSAAEIGFLERLFYRSGSDYGFVGAKPLKELGARIERSRAVGISKSGNFLYRGAAVETFRRIRQDIGPEVVLTSGIRGIPKQFLLFLQKAVRHAGNLSLASRSLAPPGYSFHGVGDFDVGRVGLGADNFTLRFTQTDVFHRLKDLGYVALRYPQANRLGVRFEPWHVKVSA